MPETKQDELEGKKVRYGYVYGNRYGELSNLVGTVRAVRRIFGEPTALGVEYPGRDLLVWASYDTWAFIKEEPKDFDIDELFTDAAGGPLAVAEAEIARLKARIAELENAVSIIKSVGKS